MDDISGLVLKQLLERLKDNSDRVNKMSELLAENSAMIKNQNQIITDHSRLIENFNEKLNEQNKQIDMHIHKFGLLEGKVDKLKDETVKSNEYMNHLKIYGGTFKKVFTYISYIITVSLGIFALLKNFGVIK